MKKTLYIHAGTHKTGSTSIQMFMHRNRDLLLQQGVYYPFVPENSLVPYQHRFVRTIAGNPGELLNYFRNASAVCNTLVISSECLLESPDIRIQLEVLKQLFDEIKIILYLRRQDEWIESMYKEMVYGGKKRLTMGFQDWVSSFLNNKPPFPYGIFWHELTGSWSTSFGSENLIIRSYDQVITSQVSLLHDFLGVIRVNSDNMKLSAFPRINTSNHDRNYYELARICNLFLRPEEKNKFFEKIYSSGYTDPHPFLSPENRTDISLAVKTSNELIENMYFNGLSCIFTPTLLHHTRPWQPYNGLPHLLITKSKQYFQSVNRTDICDFLDQYVREHKMPEEKKPAGFFQTLYLNLFTKLTGNS